MTKSHIFYTSVLMCHDNVIFSSQTLYQHKKFDSFITGAMNSTNVCLLFWIAFVWFLFYLRSSNISFRFNSEVLHWDGRKNWFILEFIKLFDHCVPFRQAKEIFNIFKFRQCNAGFDVFEAISFKQKQQQNIFCSFRF